MADTEVWWHRAWIKTTEIALGHTAAIIVGFATMVVGLGLSVTVVMLPVGIVIGLIGVAIFVAGLFAHLNGKT
jgi:hypothetical protein